MSHAEYLERERTAEPRSEYLRGEVFAMAGGTYEHGRLAQSFARLLGNALEGKPCVVLGSDVRVRIAETDRSTYPDLSVICGHRESAADDPDAITNPIVLVEVLSPSTEASDRGDKFAHYRRLGSLREYVLVSQSTPRVEVFRHAADLSWTLREYGTGQHVELASIGITIGIDDVYADPLTSG